MTAQALPRFSFEEYLRLDEVSGQRHEWVAGQVYAMSGGSDRHLATVQALFTRLAPIARARGCRPWLADRRLRTANAAYYPDVFVVCGPRADRLFEDDATVVIEVLSPSTASTDMREKAAAYLTLPSIAGYLLVDPDLGTVRVGQPDAEVGWRWLHVPADGLLPLLGEALDLAEVWREVDQVAPREQ